MIPSEIYKRVCELAGKSEEDCLVSRSPEFIIVRHLTFYVERWVMKMSPTELARKYGVDRDSVYNSCDRIEEVLGGFDTEKKQLVRRILEEFDQKVIF